MTVPGKFDESFPYPWDGLEETLREMETPALQLLAYGSLMNPQSAERTLDADTIRLGKPIVGFGIKRYFNYRMPSSPTVRHGDALSPQHVAALGIVSTRDLNDFVNGIMFSISIDEIPALREREVNYQLTQVPSKYWKHDVDVPGPVFALELSDLSDTDLLPHINYLKTCEAGARQVSEEFVDQFRRTTFLVDNTPLNEWISAHPELD